MAKKVQVRSSKRAVTVKRRRYPKGMPFKVVSLAFINGYWQDISL